MSATRRYSTSGNIVCPECGHVTNKNYDIITNLHCWFCGVIIPPSDQKSKTKQLEHIREVEVGELRSWAFQRPYMHTAGGVVLARSAKEALELVEYAYGSCTDTSVYCPSTGERNTKHVIRNQSRR